MENLIKALQIFLKYKNSKYPTHCEHDIMYIMDIEPKEVSEEDTNSLAELGFIFEEDNCFFSFRYGSA